MENVIVGERTGVTDFKPMPFGNQYAVWFEGADKVEFIDGKDIKSVPKDNRTCFQAWKDVQKSRGLEI